MHTIDIIIAIVLIFGAFRGFQKGFFHEAATLIGLIAGGYAAIVFSNVIASIIESLTSWNIQLVRIIAFIIIFLLVVALMNLLGQLITKLLKAILLGFVNKLAGLLFGIIKWGFLLAVIIFVVEYFDSDNQILTDEMMMSSLFYPLLDKFSFIFKSFF